MFSYLVRCLLMVLFCSVRSLNLNNGKMRDCFEFLNMASKSQSCCVLDVLWFHLVSFSNYVVLFYKSALVFFSSTYSILL